MTRRAGIRTVLVANRGEIAQRLFRACRKLGLESVAVYSDADAGSAWSRQADMSVPLPGTTASATYLDFDAVLGAARAAGADAIHPGYGFLSENADFAAACLDAGLVFIGPRPETIRLLGSKTDGRAAARAAGVSVVEGVDAAGLSDDEIRRAAERLGFPILVKATFGGGGRGMRVVRSPGELEEAVSSARAEAATSFGDDRLLLERYLADVRHVEVQLLGDEHGHLLHFWERECSIQRRHQKLVEESPAPGLSEDLRLELAEAAVRVAGTVGYSSAGTVEFLLEPTGRFHFIEMNTRLQVEHPVTEMATGTDLAAWQIRVAAGETLDVPQSAIRSYRHAIECRIYAEDPARDYLPSTGRIEVYRAPGGPGVRCDDGIARGALVSAHYDSLLAKVTTANSRRSDALALMGQALAETVILGVVTNVTFLQDIVAHPAFRDGDIATDFLERHFGAWQPPAPQSEDQWLALAAYEFLAASAQAAGGPIQGPATEVVVPGPWSDVGSWRNVP